MPVRLVRYGSRRDFDPIRPDETDRFSFDFASRLSATSATLADADVACAVRPDSPVADSAAASRVVAGSVAIDGLIVAALVGSLVDGAVYALTGSVAATDGRTFAWTAGLECDLDPPASPTLTVAGFRRDFPTFARASDYPDDQLDFWIEQVTVVAPLDPNRWGGNLTLGQELFVAHMATLERTSQLRTARGQTAMAVGPVASRSVGGVSVSYDLSSAYRDDASFWNLTVYGQRYIYLTEQAGMGPLYLL